MRNKKWIFVTSIILVLVLLVACTSNSISSGEQAAPEKLEAKVPDEIKIGIVGTMSGEQALNGKAMTDAIKLLQNEINADGGFVVKGKSVKLTFIVEDTEGKPEIASNAVQKLIESDGVLAIIGPNNSSEVLTSGLISQEAHIPQITHTGTNAKISDIGDYVFRACYTDPYQGKLAVKVAKNVLGAKKVAVLWNVADAYSSGLREAFVSECAAKGLEIVADESFSGAESKDYNVQLSIIKKANPDVLFLPNGVNAIPLQMQQARAMGITATFLGGDEWDYAQVPKLTGGDVIDGAYYITGFSADADTSKEFATAFEKLAGYRASFGSAMCYEAARVVLAAIQNAETIDGAGIRDAMMKTDLNLPTGHVAFDANRNAIREAVLMKFEKEVPVFSTSLGLD